MPFSMAIPALISKPQEEKSHIVRLPPPCLFLSTAALLQFGCPALPEPDGYKHPEYFGLQLTSRPCWQPTYCTTDN